MRLRTGMHYREYRPSLPLARVVECFWTLEVEAADASGEPQRIVPDGCIEWIAHVDAPPRELALDGAWHVQPQRFVVGPRLSPVVLQPSAMRCLGIRFHPAGAAAVMRAPLCSIAGRIVSSDALLPLLDRELGARLDPDASPSDWVRVAETVLVRAHAPLPDELAEAGSTAILRAHGRVSIEALATELGVHRRSLERRFERHVGLAPKQLARIARFQRVFQCTLDARVAWADVAIDCGYFDQAHLIRDFRELAGETPAALLERDLALTAAFTRRDRLSQTSNPGSARER
ncbi:MAG: DUF6597 domain-containing transcriptional factor [Planctomycetota bacterium]